MNSDTPKIKPTKFDKQAYHQQLLQARKPSQQKTKKNTQSTNNQKDTIQKVSSIPITVDTILTKFTYGKIKMDTAKTQRQKLVFLINTDTANKLDLKLSTTDTLANLRITQIIDSQGNSDGPFGRETLYEIKTKGIHKIIVSESQMNGEPWAGKFTFQAQLKW